MNVLPGPMIVNRSVQTQMVHILAAVCLVSLLILIGPLVQVCATNTPYHHI